jgi:hypothetical protein
MIISSDDDYIKYVPINLSDSAKSFPAYVESQNSGESEEEDHDDLSNPVRKGFHAFVKLTSAYLRVVGRNDEASAGPEFRPTGDSFQPPYQVNAKTVVNESSVPDGKFLISIVYKLNSTRDHGEVYNCRQLYQIDDEVFVYVEYGYFQPHEVKIDRDNTKILSLEGLIIFAKLSQILEDFMYWLVEVDPIGFELLRRMASAATAGCGVAVRREVEGGRWLWEPLAAVWPRVALGRVEAALGDGRLSLQRLMDELAGAGMTREWGEEVPVEWLANANTPEEWAALGRVMG